MKGFKFVIVLIFSVTMNLIAQEQKKDTIPMFMPVQSDAAFRENGKLYDFREWVLNQIQVPKSAILDSLHGKIIVKFTIDKYGNIKNMKLLDSIRVDLDNEILRVISTSPKWKSATQAGRHVSQTFKMPFLFDFRLNSIDSTTYK